MSRTIDTIKKNMRENTYCFLDERCFLQFRKKNSKFRFGSMIYILPHEAQHCSNCLKSKQSGQLSLPILNRAYWIIWNQACAQRRGLTPIADVPYTRHPAALSQNLGNPLPCRVFCARVCLTYWATSLICTLILIIIRFSTLIHTIHSINT